MPNWKRPFPVKSITDSFDDHKNRARGSKNPGTDYAAARGANVIATADGVVEMVKNTISGAAGRVIIVKHSGGWRTEYLHLSQIRVKVGQPVKQGHHIGDVGGSGNGSEKFYGYHLHLTLSKGNTPLSGRGNVDFEKAVSAQVKAEKVKPVIVADPKPVLP
jgi:murein DD-endopeptidase